MPGTNGPGGCRPTRATTIYAVLCCCLTACAGNGCQCDEDRSVTSVQRAEHRSSDEVPNSDGLRTSEHVSPVEVRGYYDLWGLPLFVTLLVVSAILGGSSIRFSNVSLVCIGAGGVLGMLADTLVWAGPATAVIECPVFALLAAASGRAIRQIILSANQAQDNRGNGDGEKEREEPEHDDQ